MKLQLRATSLLLFLAACSNNPAATTVTVWSSKGSMAGKTSLYGIDFRYKNDGSGVLISSDGSDITALSKPDGSWQLDSIPQGTHVISCSKDGYFGIKYFNILIPGPGVQYFVGNQLAELWTAKLKIDSCTKPSSNGYFLIYYSCVDTSLVPPYSLVVDTRPSPFPNSDSVVTINALGDLIARGSHEAVAQTQLSPPEPLLGPLFLSIMGRVDASYEVLQLQKQILSPGGPRSDTFELLQ